MYNFNFSLDDFSPHPKAGLDFESIKWCNKVIETYPDFKINLFVPAAFARLGDNPYYITKHLDWVKKVNDLPEKNFKINMHGFFHRRVDKKHQQSNNDELEFLNEQQANDLLIKMKNEFRLSGLKYSKVLRPPGFKISTSTAKVLFDDGFIISTNRKYCQGIKNKLKGRLIEVNWDIISPPPKNCDIVCFGHTSNWTKNFFDGKRYDILMRFLDKQKFEFKFIEE